MDTVRLRTCEAKSVPMAQGRHLFPCRTQKLSLAAVTILGVHPWENSTVPNYRIRSPNRTPFLFAVLFSKDHF
jgi:hypothetical protein